MRRFLTAMTGIVMLWGCDALQPDKATLWSTSSAPVERQRCDACHGFAPRTGAHRFHLDTMMSVNHSQNQITCMDCHAASIAFSRTKRIDSVFYDPTFVNPSKHTAGFPWQKFIRGETPDEINTLDSTPVAWAEREKGAENPFWITTEAKAPGLPGHANGVLDVVFAQRNDNWIPDGESVPRKATWDPVRLSCNAVACHGHEASNTVKYVWKEPKK
jgi:hypothetical protein